MSGVKIRYRGNLRCECIHEDSGADLVTDAPKDNHGGGDGFSPTDLMAAALGSCILSVMGIAARMNKLDISGATAVVDKTMVTHPVRRIAGLSVKVHVPHKLDDGHKALLEKAAHTCPVHKSIHPEIETPMQFIWG